MEKIVRSKLKSLRRRFYPQLGEFSRVTMMAANNVRKVEKYPGRTLPSVKKLHRWVAACDSSMSRFYAEVEQELNGKPGPEPDKAEQHPLIEAVKVLVCRDPKLADNLYHVIAQLNFEAA